MISYKMKNYLILFTLLIFGFGYNLSAATPKPTAKVVSSDTAWCVKADSTIFTVKFSGKPPYGIIYRLSYADGTTGDVTYSQISLDNWLELKSENVDTLFTFKLFNITKTHTVSIEKIFDSNMPMNADIGGVKSWDQWNDTTHVDVVNEQMNVRIDIMPQPKAGNDTAVCNYSSVLKGKKSLTNDSVFWTSITPGVVFENYRAENSTASVMPQVSSQSDYVLNMLEVNGTCSSNDQVTYRFNGFAEATLSGTTEVCGTGNIATTLVTNANYPISYTYKDVLSTDISTPIEVNETPFTSTISAAGNQTFKLNSVIDKNGCITPPINLLVGEANSVDVKPKPFAGNDQTVCSNSTTITAVPDLLSGWWSVDGDGTFADSTSKSTIYTQPTDSWGQTRIYWNEIYQDWCSNSSSFVVEFQKAPIANAGLDSILFLDTQITLNANEPEFGVGTWTTSNPVVNIANPKSYNTIASDLPYEKVRLTWTVENGICPSATDFIDLLVKGFTYSNGFTPNGDGINDYFEIFGLMQRPILNNELKVFDAVGRLVYSEKDYKNSWNGNDMKGNSLPTGAYYYQFSGDGIEPVQSYLIIKRE